MKDAVINGLAERIEFDIEQDKGGLLRPVFVKAGDEREQHSSPGMNVNSCALGSEDEGDADGGGGGVMGRRRAGMRGRCDGWAWVEMYWS